MKIARLKRNVKLNCLSEMCVKVLLVLKPKKMSLDILDQMLAISINKYEVLVRCNELKLCLVFFAEIN